MVRAFLLLGSNMGERATYLENARFRISLLVGKLFSASSIYETAAWGKEDQPAFLNQVVGIETALAPRILLETLLAIEDSLGRTRTEKWAARTIDLDILFYGNQIVEEPGLVIPHPAFAQRKFALVPMAAVAPSFIHPVLKKSVEVLLVECNDSLDVVAWSREVGQ